MCVDICFETKRKQLSKVFGYLVQEFQRLAVQTLSHISIDLVDLCKHDDPFESGRVGDGLATQFFKRFWGYAAQKSTEVSPKSQSNTTAWFTPLSQGLSDSLTLRQAQVFWRS